MIFIVVNCVTGYRGCLTITITKSGIMKRRENMKITGTKKKTALLVLYTLLVLAIGTPDFALAQSTQIRACVQKSSQQVRIIGASESCRQAESLVIWNSQGPKGDPGEPGLGMAMGWIVGRFYPCPGQNVAGRLVFIPGKSFQAYSDAQGHFALSYVPPGTWTVSLPSLTSEVTAQVVAGQTFSLGDINLLSDPQNCGGCGISCPGSCANGQCRYLTSCQDIYQADPAKPSGPYTIYPDGTVNSATRVCCNMTTGGAEFSCGSPINTCLSGTLLRRTVSDCTGTNGACASVTTTIPCVGGCEGTYGSAVCK
jgi:hypothetical protein